MATEWFQRQISRVCACLETRALGIRVLRFVLDGMHTQDSKQFCYSQTNASKDNNGTLSSCQAGEADELLFTLKWCVQWGCEVCEVCAPGFAKYKSDQQWQKLTAPWFHPSIIYHCLSVAESERYALDKSSLPHDSPQSYSDLCFKSLTFGLLAWSWQVNLLV